MIHPTNAVNDVESKHRIVGLYAFGIDSDARFLPEHINMAYGSRRGTFSENVDAAVHHSILVDLRENRVITNRESISTET